jgi:photosystem II stability/assembly factor-like uncharacterized protein
LPHHQRLPAGIAVRSSEFRSFWEIDMHMFRFHAVLTATIALAVVLPIDAAARPKPNGASTAAEREAAWQQHQRMERESLFKGLEWRDIGPTVQGGRVVDFESVPGQPYTFYVAYATGGVWKTTNNGGSFEPLTDRLPSTVIGDIAIDPSSPETLWVGSGEPNAARSNYGGHGLFVSRDGGKTFEPKGLADSDRIARVIVDPRDGNRVFVAAAGKLYSTGGSRGIFLTEDGGSTWTQVLEGEGDWTGASDLVMHPTDPDTLYAALWERKRTPWHFTESGSGSSVHKSTDGGRTWQRLANFPGGAKIGRIGLDIARSQPGTVACAPEIDGQGRIYASGSGRNRSLHPQRRPAGGNRCRDLDPQGSQQRDRARPVARASGRRQCGAVRQRCLGPDRVAFR